MVVYLCFEGMHCLYLHDITVQVERCGMDTGKEIAGLKDPSEQIAVRRTEKKLGPLKGKGKR
jgi:hypothetical protein